MAKVIEVLELKENYPIADEAYTVGQVDDGRYFFAWGGEYPKDDEVPAYEVLTSDSGISYHSTEEEARKEMQDAVDAAESIRD